MNVILTIISAIAAFCCAVLIGSNRQKAKDDRKLKEYKTEAEAAIRESNREAAKAKAEEKRTVRENDLLKEAVNIVRQTVAQDGNVELEEKVKDIEDDSEAIEILNAMKADSERRAEELGRRYER